VIISASYKTDIPAFYGRWFLNRLEAGHCLMVNPYGGRTHRIDLSAEAVDGFVFWTRNAAPFGDALEAVAARGTPFMIQMTVTGYPRALESNVLETARAVDQVRALSRRWGPRAVVWRYDPVVLSSLTDEHWHRANFARTAEALKGSTDEVVLSFLQPYRKTERNLGAAASLHGFDWRDPPVDEKRELLAALAAIAADAGMTPTLCTQPHLLDVPGVSAARCIDRERLSDIAGTPVAGRRKGNRPGCDCAESRDIGDYDTCTQGCAYCYAVNSRTVAQRRLKAHDPEGEMLRPGGLKPAMPASGR
jgi:hypothetical protein